MAEKVYTKKEILDIIKSINIDEMTIPEEAQRKWYKFGAYDSLRMVSEKIKDSETEKVS